MSAALPQDRTDEIAQRNQRQAEVVAALAPALPPHALLWRREDTVPYECEIGRAHV